MIRIDLHCHTTASDGLLSPAELVARARTDHVDVIAVTDHDTVAGVAEAVDAADGVRVVPGIELSARHDGRNVHVLGYFLDVDSDVLATTLAALKDDRLARARRIVERLNELGYDLTMDEVDEHARGDVIARPHIARAMVVRGYVSSVRDAFTQDLIADGGRADVPKRALTPGEAVSLIRAASGAPVIAHPGVGHHDGPVQAIGVELLRELRDAGLVGLEVDHPDHPPLVRDRLRALAADLDLVPTGGSDFHGDPGHALGRWTTWPDALATLETRAG
ncbi:MAG: PHP domain-containing protein [Actinomycetota bacterium]